MNKIIALAIILITTGLLAPSQAQIQTAFAVASIRPSGAEVKFEREGLTEIQPGTLRMRDVTIARCIKWAYALQQGQTSGPSWIDSEHFDITAKADDPATEEQMKLMMQTLLAERFKLTFHRQKREMSAFVLTQTRTGSILKEAAPGGSMTRQNSANGMVAKSMSMEELANYISSPMEKPVVDRTALKGRYDFVLDLKPFLPEDGWASRPDLASLLNAAMQAEFGLKLEPHKEMVEVLVVDHVEKPGEN